MWVTIQEAPRYEINERGEIRSKARGTRPTMRLDKDGYLTVWLLKERGAPLMHRRVHRLVASAFIGNPNNLPEINHINHIKDDNRVENLEWCTTEYNLQEAHGHKVKVLKGDQCIGIFPSIKKAAEAIGLSDTMIGYCLNGRYDSARGYRFVHAK